MVLHRCVTGRGPIKPHGLIHAFRLLARITPCDDPATGDTWVLLGAGHDQASRNFHLFSLRRRCRAYSYLHGSADRCEWQ